jgi:predicted ABC-type ATPase
VSRPVFYLLAGPNGAGKSTLYRAAVAEGLIPATVEFVNADLHEAAHLQHVHDAPARSLQARVWSDQRRAELMVAGGSFVSETVFSHPSKIDLIRAAQAAGFVVVLMVVCVEDPQALLRRVAQRVREGGHGVPAERILARYPRTLLHLEQACRLADLALFYDTSAPAQELMQPHRLVARCRSGEVVWQADDLPRWATRVLPSSGHAGP